MSASKISSEDAGEGTGEALPSTIQPGIPQEMGPILEMLPEDQRGRALILMSRVVSKAYRGPVPDAEEMAKYKSVDATFPERFVAAFEREQAHRHGMDKADQSNGFSLQKFGQDKAFYALIFLGFVMLTLTFMGSPEIAGIVAGTTVLGVVGMFITGRVIEYKSSQTDIDS